MVSNKNATSHKNTIMNFNSINCPNMTIRIYTNIISYYYLRIKLHAIMTTICFNSNPPIAIEIIPYDNFLSPTHVYVTHYICIITN